MTDLVVDYYATRPDLRPYSEEMMGGSPEEVPDIYRERSPIEFVNNIRGRLLIVQGLKDPNVTPDNVHAVTKPCTGRTSPTNSSPSKTRATASPDQKTSRSSTHAWPTSSTMPSTHLLDPKYPQTRSA